jgi:hypothetical protein
MRALLLEMAQRGIDLAETTPTTMSRSETVQLRIVRESIGRELAALYNPAPFLPPSFLVLLNQLNSEGCKE